MILRQRRYPHHDDFRVVSSSLVENRYPRASRSRSSFFRFRRDVAEGTFEDMFIDDDFDDEDIAERRNSTASERVRRQSGFPGAENDKTDKSR